MSTTATAEKGWMSARAARATLGVGVSGLERLAERRRLTVRRLPDCPPMYLRADVERLARECTTWAEACAG